MKRNVKMLLVVDTIDSVIEGWVGIWFVKIFIDMISSNIVSMNSIISSGMGIFTMFVVVKRFPKPKVHHILIAWIFSYGGLVGLYFGPEVFILTSTIMTCSLSSLYRAFHANILEINVIQRAKFDIYDALLGRIGAILGAGVAYFTLLSDIAYWKVWIGIYIAFDINLIITLLLVRTSVLKYHNGHKEEPEYYI